MSSNNRILTINVVGAGSWGGTMAQHLACKQHSVTAWHADNDELREMAETRTHPYIPDLILHQNIKFIPELSLFEPSDIVIISVPSQVVRDVVERYPRIRSDSIVVNLTKGIEIDTLLRMSEVICEVGEIDPANIVTLSGPSHAEEVAKKIPTVVVVAGIERKTIEFVQTVFSSETFRIYTNTDIVGVELGGSIKNVIAIAAGVCDGIGFGDNTKAALITRGIVEITRLGVAMGAKPETLAGLSGIGDLVVTCLSRHSRNRLVGEEIGKGRKLSGILKEMKVVAEGVETSKSVVSLMNKYKIEMPICSAMYSILFEEENPKDAVRKLMTREPKYERKEFI